MLESTRTFEFHLHGENGLKLDPGLGVCCCLLVGASDSFSAVRFFIGKRFIPFSFFVPVLVICFYFLFYSKNKNQKITIICFYFIQKSKNYNPFPADGESLCAVPGRSREEKPVLQLQVFAKIYPPQ